MDLLHKKNINSSDINCKNKLSTKMDWKFAKQHIVWWNLLILMEVFKSNGGHHDDMSCSAYATKCSSITKYVQIGKVDA